MYKVEPIRGVNMHQALNRISIEMNKKAFILLTRDGPFWDRKQQHSSDEWFECRGEIVTDSGIGEAAFQTFQGIDSSLISIKPSCWNYSSLKVTWVRDALPDSKVTLINLLDKSELENELRTLEPPILNWDRLLEKSKLQFTNLTFSDDCFTHLDGVPFVKSSMKTLFKLFKILNKYATCFTDGKRTEECQEIYKKYFTGENALFSDSSDTEKSKYREKLMFPHPCRAGEKLFCPRHGKEKHLTLRVHYERSDAKDNKIYIVYVGEKLTKQ